MRVELLRYPTDEDWQRCKALALATAGKEPKTPVDEAWKRRILAAGHSPIRTLMFTIRLEVPYWVSVHLVRHKVGIEHYVRSQRNDRQSDYDRNSARQDSMVTHVIDANAQALMQLVQTRTCGMAAKETREVAWAIAEAVTKACPEFDGLLMPKCAWTHGCHEFRPCGWYGGHKGQCEMLRKDG